MPLKFNRVDKLILSFALAIICVFSFFLYDDSFLFRGRESRNSKIGNLKQAENDVRLRASDSFTWNPARKAEVVFERDSVFTGKHSQTQIDLIDGSKIFLNENSLVTLVAKNGRLELNLRYGNIQTEINPNSKLELKAGSQKILLNKDSGSSKLEIKKPKYGLTKIKLIAGKMSVQQSVNSAVEELVKDQAVIVKPTGTIQKTAVGTISLLTPDKSLFYQNTIEKAFFLDWHSQGTEKNTLSIAKDKDFKTIVFSESNIKTKVHVKDLTPGSYYWKVVGIDGSNSTIQTEARTFTIQFLEKLALVEPIENKRIDVEVKGDPTTHQEPVTISWTNIYENVQLQISKAPTFKDIALEKDFEKTFTFTQPVTSGKYFVRVRGKKESLFTEWSDVRSFEVVVRPKGLIKPEAPVLLSKKLTFNSSQSRSPSSISPTTINWKASAAAIKYEVEVSVKDPKFSKANRFPAKGTQFNFVPKTTGQHYYRVRAISSDNVPSDYSDVGELQTKFHSPKLNSIAPVILRSDNPESTPPPASMKLSWSPVYLASKYLIEVSEDENFKTSEKLISPTPTFSYEAKNTGSFFFRIIASDTSGGSLSDASNVQSSQYTYIKRLPKPVLIEPKNKMTVFLQKEIEPFIWLNWESAADLKQFELEIGLDKNYTKIVTRQKLDEAKFLIKTKLPLGKIYWRVRQLHEDPNRISDWTESREFQLIHNKNEGVFK